MSDTQKLSMHITPESIAAGIAQRCYRDAAFRKKFAADPEGTLERESNKKLPPGVQLVLCKNDDKRWYIPVPAVREDQELRDADLEKISAGEVVGVVVAGTVISGILAVGIASIGVVIALKEGQL